MGSAPTDERGPTRDRAAAERGAGAPEQRLAPRSESAQTRCGAASGSPKSRKLVRGGSDVARPRWQRRARARRECSWTRNVPSASPRRAVEKIGAADGADLPRRRFGPGSACSSARTTVTGAMPGHLQAQRSARSRRHRPQRIMERVVAVAEAAVMPN